MDNGCVYICDAASYLPIQLDVYQHTIVIINSMKLVAMINVYYNVIQVFVNVDLGIPSLHQYRVLIIVTVRKMGKMG